jgi:hypothetical protein
MNDGMKKLLLAFAVFVSCPVWAEWRLASSNKDGEIYFDYETIRKDGKIRKSWSLQNLRSRGKSGELSSRIRVEHDCKNENYRMMSISLHSEPMAGVDLLFNEAFIDPQWIDIAPYTSMASILKIICSR